ncbi:MAG: six-cysteine ranthipeptide SCIFF [Eubacteriales bacterium]
MNKVLTISKPSLIKKASNEGCGECQTSCQSACKTSCTVANQKCENTKRR